MDLISIESTNYLAYQFMNVTWETLPVVRAVGGLHDTITDCTPEALANGTANGFRFGPYTATAFQQAVHRYIHDFEAMLRRVVADKDGGIIAVTLMSSDTGKLYAALAQVVDKRR